MFQFQTGAIKSLSNQDFKVLSETCFNSKLVRLKGGDSHALNSGFISFQFQTGAIKSKPGLTCKNQRGSTFQFQTGAIKRRLSAVSVHSRFCSFNSKLVRLKGGGTTGRQDEPTGFNSKLVRLKGARQVHEVHHHPWFQFQTGAIKSSTRGCYRPQSGLRFNSKLVRLKGKPSLVLLSKMQVSIPNWCD